MNRRLALKQLAALGALSAFGTGAFAQRQAYQTLGTKVPTEVAGKVEVIEFFSYGCPHCHDFEPLLNGWAKKLQGDVNFVKVPITFNRPEWTALARLYYTLDGDEAIGVSIVRRALEAPVRQIAENAGQEGSVIVAAVKGQKVGEGFDALKGEYVNMFEKGIVDAAKVTRSALQHAASIAGMVLTTETLVTDKPEKKDSNGAGGHDHGGDMDY